MVETTLTCISILPVLGSWIEFYSVSHLTAKSPTFVDVNDDAVTTTDTGGGGLTATAKGGATVPEAAAVDGTGFTGARMTVGGAAVTVTVGGRVVMTVVGARNSSLGPP